MFSLLPPLSKTHPEKSALPAWTANSLGIQNLWWIPQAMEPYEKKKGKFDTKELSDPSQSFLVSRYSKRNPIMSVHGGDDY